METFDHKAIEKRWQEQWEKDRIYLATDDAGKPKKLILVEFPYPSGEGLHMGHLRPFLAGDIYSRYWRMNGYNVMYPMGWDAFGLPAENFAIKNKLHPAVSTAKNVANAKRQLQSWGTGFDWSREVNTSDPEYYKWTQWIFLQFFKAGLAYEATGLINWCPKDKTGLANEEVVNGCCERCGTPVEKKELRQWYLKITAYAEKLLNGLKTLNWPDQVKIQQENWIGRKEGINISYEIETKRNYVILHGWDSNSKDPKYAAIKKEIEKTGAVCALPDLPSTSKPTEAEQVEFVLKNIRFDENTILYGKSLGGVVAMKVLEKLKNPIAGLVLAGSFVGPDGLQGEYPFINSFRWEFDFEKIRRNAGFIKILSDLKDHAVKPTQGKILHEKLGGELTETIAVKSHFGAEHEPAVIEALLPKVTVFTTRPDTNFGATFVVIGPEHRLLNQRNPLNISEKYWKEIQQYQQKVASESDMDRVAEGRKKTGVFTGLYCINNLNGYRMPLYVADYVLGHVGTGAVVGVPGHDKRDFEFAQIFNIPIVRVVQKDRNDSGPITSLEQVQEDEGTMINSDFLNGLDIHQATVKIMDHMEMKGYGKRVVNYKLRDWVFSRQRYWGEPIPLIHCDPPAGGCGVVPVPDEELPLKLPEVKDYEPTGTGESPLAAIDSWVNTKCPKCGGKARRETNTMPQWAGSSWYWLRYSDPHNDKEFAAKQKLKYWQPVDMYFGGMEHTTLHLLYSRFWNQFLFDQSLVTESEPYLRRVPHGLILGPDGEKMSKSRGNVVNPDDVVAEFGADVLRMCEPFLGPHEASVPWSDKGIIGIKRFLDKVWRLSFVFASEAKQSQEIATPTSSARNDNSIHKLIKKISSDIENFKFNTAIAAFMEFLNENKELSQADWEKFLILLAPFAPHVTEELWHQLGHKDSVHRKSWPKFDEKLVKAETVTVVVQVLGRLRASLELPAGTSQAEVKVKAMADANVKKHLEGKQVVKEIFVPDKLINFVVK
ncbi:MAG: hypothetical protein A3E29_03090 [Candidatus Doudnabacteria bacterium RIFCSPHIGHO2_12_FULL_48_16]|uniref:Leucine--tRNA ligase n=1 Tax=Candidatus Doudnabacteria bacterium RIFCSPHIGHO2_12_FULL_48_16 TaxID=1817838 RepID=A0A1F5PJE1_9BACT|nr:MAG: hypothetical protein A3E29_03090 [Candidatus Doudnabacteria bacterium RIFCSPHIGHO2_12_FULL_48_16]